MPSCLCHIHGLSGVLSYRSLRACDTRDGHPSSPPGPLCVVPRVSSASSVPLMIYLYVCVSLSRTEILPSRQWHRSLSSEGTLTRKWGLYGDSKL